MGILSALLGDANPAAQWANSNSNFLGAIGAGLGQGQNIQSGLSAGLSAVPQAKALDRENAEKLKAEAKVAAQTNATKAWLEQNHPDLAQAVDAGLSVSDAWQEAFRRQGAKTEAPQNPYMSAGDGQFFNWQTGEYVSNPDAQPEMPTAPSGYRWGQGGGLEFIPGGPADPAMKGADLTQAEQRNQQLATVIEPELATVEQNWTALTDAGNQMKDAEIGGTRPGRALTSPEYQQAINSLSTIVASYLYSVSGATATDEEIRRQVDLLTPKLGESEQSVANKLERIKTYARAVTTAGGGASPAGATSGNGWTVIGVE